MSKELSKNGIIFIGIDLPGHGYSTGLKAYIPDINGLVSCCFNLIKTLFKTDGDRDDNNFYMNRKKLLDKSIPLFLIGQSLGGGICLLLAHKLQTTPLTNVQFAGSILLCPLLRLYKPPPKFIQFMLKYTVVPFFSRAPMFSFLRSQPVDEGRNHITYDKYLKYDTQQGLSYNGGVRFGSALTMIEINKHIKKVIPAVSYPFLVVMDPNDKVVSFDEVVNFVNSSRTNMY